MSAYNLIWNIGGNERKHSLRGYPVFIGRIPYGLRDRIKDYNPLGVYIYYPDTDTAYFTGIISATVSRYHVKIEEENNNIFLIDHGADGKGSRNGTYLNGERIKPGQRVLLRPGDSFQLGRLGPVFMLTMRRIEGETIVMKEGVPALMPKSLAKKLEGVEGIQVESYDESSALVVPSFHGDKKIVTEGLVIHSERLSERERVLKALFHVESIVSDALEYIITRQDVESAKNILMKLQLRAYCGLIENIKEKEIQRVYHELLKFVKMDIVDVKAVAERLRTLKHLIREFIENF